MSPVTTGFWGLEALQSGADPMLNGTAVTARSLIAILENVQDEDCSVAVPPMLERKGAPSRVGAAG